MSTFKIDDLMVTLLPQGVQCGEAGWGHDSHHPGGSPMCRITGDTCKGKTCGEACAIDDVKTPAHLEELRGQLQAALDRVKARQGAVGGKG